ncbi:hypothetical protein [Zavarzinella formosa]|uniref:hypothetical protein n=1 Tax=Zavarzinella formosa TaxID=360055 RepID=UPI00030FFD0E|nr:hypothetical protein [Zavarzinella formosa]
MNQARAILLFMVSLIALGFHWGLNRPDDRVAPPTFRLVTIPIHLELEKIFGPMSGRVILKESDLIDYDWQTHTMYVREGVWNSAWKHLEIGLVFGVGFELQAGGVACYHGAFTCSLSSHSQSGVVIDLLTDGSPSHQSPSEWKIELGYPTRGHFQGEDPRSDPRIRAVLVRLGKLRE